LQTENKDQFLSTDFGLNEFVENELFGHKRGAYSQAFENSKGLVEEPRDLDLPKVESDEEHLAWTQPYHHLKRKIIDSFESQYIGKLLKEHRGNVSSAARSAHLDRRTFQQLMAKHKLRKKL
jgi:DNA-binding NtrC family response regulator